MDDIEKREQAWKYFELHAKQRMQIFNYYIVVATAIIGGIGTFLGLNKIPTLLILSLEIILIALTVVFWCLDSRTRFLIKHAEKYLIELEQNNPTNFINLFQEESQLSSPSPSYTKAFRTMYVLFILLGSVALLYTLLCK